MVATTTAANNVAIDNATTKEELWQIIYNGRQFLEALEKFATIKFPNEEEDEATQRVDKPTQKLQKQQQQHLPNHQQENNKKRSSTVVDVAQEANLDVVVDSLDQQSARYAQTQEADEGTNDDDDYNDVVIHQPMTDQNHNHISYKKRNNCNGAIIQYCASTGKQVGRFQTVKEAARVVVAEASSSEEQPIKENSCISSINNVLGGRAKSHKGYYYHHEDDTATPLPEFPICTKSKHPKATRQSQRVERDEETDAEEEDCNDNEVQLEDSTMTENNYFHHISYKKRNNCNGVIIQYCASTGKQVGRFQSVKEAARAVFAEASSSEEQLMKENSCISSINNVLGGRAKRYKGYYYHHEDDTSTPLPEFPISTKSKHPKAMRRSQRVMVDRGEVIRYCAHSGQELGRYKTQKDAARELLATHASLSSSSSQTTTNDENERVERLRCSVRRVLVGMQRTFHKEFFRYENDERPLPVFPITITSPHPMDDGPLAMVDNDNNNDNSRRQDAHPRYEQRPEFKVTRAQKGMVVRYCGQTGGELGRYDSQSEAAKLIASEMENDHLDADAIRHGIGNVLRGRKRIHMGQYFRYSNDQRPLPAFPITKTSRHPMDSGEKGASFDTPVAARPFKRKRSLSGTVTI